MVILMLFSLTNDWKVLAVIFSKFQTIKLIDRNDKHLKEAKKCRSEY